LNPRNVADARLFALETAFRAVRPTDPMPFEATFLLDIGLSQQMTMAFTAHHISTRTKQDAIDYYVSFARRCCPPYRTPRSIDSPTKRRGDRSPPRLGASFCAMRVSIQPRRHGSSCGA
jgi:hypothetical protein